MKKILLWIVSIVLFSIYSNSYASIIEDPEYMKNINWIFLWIKKFDIEKFWQDNSTYYTNRLEWYYNEDQKSFLKYYTTKEDKNELNPYLYYEFEVDSNKIINSIKDFKWNELEFENIMTPEWSFFRIYVSEFYNTVNKEYYSYDEYKYQNLEYLKKEEIIKVEFGDSTGFEFKFKSNLPNFEIKNDNEWWTIILKDNKNITLDLNWENREGIFINEINYERAFDTEYKSWSLVSIYTNEELDTNYEKYLIWTYWNYDLHTENYQVINSSFCESDKNFYFSYDNYEWTYRIRNEWYNEFSLKSLELDMKKYDIQNWIIDFNNYDFDIKQSWYEWEWTSFDLDIKEDWLYKIKMTWESNEEYLCKKYYDTNINTNYIEDPYLMNENLFYKDWENFWAYANFENLFIDLIDNWLRIKWEYQDFLDKIEKFDFRIKNDKWETIYVGDKSCIDNYECENEYEELIYQYLQENNIFWKINLEIDYKDKFTDERKIVLDNIMWWEQLFFEDIVNTENGFFYFNPTVAEIISPWSLNSPEWELSWPEWEQNFSDYSIKVKGENWEYITLKKIDNNEMDEIDSIVMDKIFQEYWDTRTEQEVYINFIEEEIINRYWNISMNVAWAIYINNNQLIDKIEVYKNWILKKEFNILNKINLIWNKLNFYKISDNYYHFNTNRLDFETTWNISWVNYSSNNQILEAKELIEQEDYYFDYWDWNTYILNDENLLYNNNREKLLYINPSEWSNITILIPKEIIEKVNNIQLIWDEIKSYKEVIIKSELININEIKRENLKLKSWETFSIMHKFKETQKEWVLFKREVNILLQNNNIEWGIEWWPWPWRIPDYRVNIDINWENINEINNEKLYICKEEIESLDKLNDKEVCKNKKNIDFFGYYIKWEYNSERSDNGAIDFYIYGLDWIVNKDFENINIEFEVEKYIITMAL